MAPKKACDGCCAAICTILYIGTWVLLIAGVGLFHYSVKDVIPHLKDLNVNIKNGFDITLGFQYLKDDSDTVMDAAEQALGNCSVIALNCPVSDSNINRFKFSDTKEQMDTVYKAFNHSLTRIQKVVNDKYLGLDDFKNTATNLDTVLAQTKRVEEESKNSTRADGKIPCRASVPSFCKVYQGGKDLKDGVVNVQNAINDLVDPKQNEAIRTFEDYSDYFDYLHGFPYVLVLSALFFLGFWCRKDATCCCRGDGDCLNCLFLVLHLLFGLIFFVVNAIFVALGYLAQYETDRDELRITIIKGSPTVKELMDHIRGEYPEFWNEVFNETENNLLFFWYSAVIFEAFCVLILLYGCCVYCCRPYQNKAEKSEG